MKKTVRKKVEKLEEEVKQIFHHHKEKDMADQQQAATGQPVTPKREMTPAEAEEVLDRLHYCKRHGKKMEPDEHLAYHCEIDDKEKAAAEEKEAQEAWAVYSKAHPPEAKK